MKKILSIFGIVLTAVAGISLYYALATGGNITLSSDSVNLSQSATSTITANTSSYTNLQLSFNYDVTNLDGNDKLSFGWATGTNPVNILGFINGHNGTSTDTGATSSISLPVGAQDSNLNLYFISNGGTNDNATVTNVILTGDSIPTPTLSAPNLYVSNQTSHSFVLHWNDVAGATSYEVFKDGSSTGSTTSTSSAITGLNASTSYAMFVVATDGTNFATSSTLIETTDPAPVDHDSPSTPANFATTSVTNNSIGLTWDPSTDTGGSGLAYYSVGYKLQSSASTTIATTTNTNFTITGLTASSTYILTVSAFDNAGNASGIASLEETTSSPSSDVTPPSTPGNLDVENILDTSFILSWDSSTDNESGVAYYKYTWATNEATTTSQAVQITGLTPNTPYFLTVKAYDNAGNVSGEASMWATTTNTGGSGTTTSSVINITNATELCDAIEHQVDGQTWNISAGNYPVTQCNTVFVGGQTGWYLPIIVNNLTIKGAGASSTTLYGSGYTANGAWATQDLVAIFGDNVTLDGITFMPKVEPNKTIEVMGSNSIIKNVIIRPNTLTDQAEYSSITGWGADDPKQWGGSIYYNNATGSQTLNNVTIYNGGVSLHSPNANFSISNVNLNYKTDIDWINGYRFYIADNPLSLTGTPNYTYHVDNVLNNIDSVLVGLGDNTTLLSSAPENLVLDSDISVNKEIAINKSNVLIEGNNHTISPTFAKTDNDNNAVFGILGVDKVTVQNLTIDGIGGTNLHGINIWNSGNGSDVITLWRVNSMNNDHSGINVVSSKVVATDITTSGNGWHGIDVDHSSDTSLPQPWIKIAGMNHLGELPPLPLIYFDHFDPSQVQIDNPSLYTYINHYVTSTDRAYFLAITIPTPTSPRWIKAPSTILGAYTNVNLVTPTWDAPTSTIVDHYEYSFTRPSDNNWSTPSNLGNVTSIPNQVFGTAGANQGEEGPWQFRVRAVDALGNTSAWATSSILIYDHTAPTDTIDTPVDYVNTTLPFTISGTYHDINGTTIQSGVGRLHIYISANGHTLANPFIVNSSQLNSASGTYTYTLTQSDLNKLVTELNLQNGQQFTIKAWVYDRANNWTHTDKTFTVDTTAPAKPVITNPLNRPNLIQQQWFKTTPILNKWNAVTQDVNGDPENMGSYQIAYQYDDGHTFSGSTCSATTTINGNWVGCRDVNGTQRNHIPGLNEEGGVTIWVRAIDVAGNVGAWSDPVHYFYDHTAPNTTLNISSVVNGQFTVSGTSTDNLALNRVYVQLVKDSSPRCGGTTVHFISIPFSTSSPWSVNYDIASLYNVNATTSLCGPGNYRATAAVTDMAGNTYQLPWSTTFVVPAIDNIAPLSYFTNATNSPVDEGYYNSDFLVGYGVTDETELNSVNVSLRNYNTWGWAAGCYDNLNEATGTKIDEGTCTMGTNVPDGKYYVSIFGQDTALNFSQNATRTVIIDKTLPTLNITSATTTSSTTLVFNGYVADTNLNYYYCWLTKKNDSTEILGTRNSDCVTKWANGADHFGSSTNPVELGGFDISDILDGDYTIHLIAKDKAGNQSSEVTYDTTVDRSVNNTGSGTGGTGTGNNTPSTPQFQSFGGGAIPYTSDTYNPNPVITGGQVLGASAYQFSEDLKLGSIGDEVQALQQFLNLKGFKLADDGAGSPGQETNYFGPRTQAALIAYQEANPAILTNVGIMDGVGTGNFFASTREFVNNVLLNDATTSEYLTNH